MVDKLLQEWRKGVFKPVCWLQGDEDFYIDEVVRFAEREILSEQEASFNLTVFYGKDAQWADVVNACRRYPMFAERQVVILKEAQFMREIGALEAYVQKPMPTTLLVVAYKDKKLDGRTSFPKTIERCGTLVTTKKMYDDKLPEWTRQHLQRKGYGIGEKALVLLIDHIGNDLARIVNELDKTIVNLGDRKTIDEDDIEQYVGVSKEFNVFELQSALVRKDLPTAIRILEYFEANPKAGAIQQVLVLLYTFFSKVYMVFGLPSHDERSVASALGVNPFFVRDYMTAARQHGQAGVERIFLLMHHYAAKGNGIGSLGVSGANLMKELVVKVLTA